MIEFSHYKVNRLLEAIHRSHQTGYDKQACLHYMSLVKILTQSYHAKWEYDHVHFKFILTFEDSQYETFFKLKYSDYL